MVFSVYRGVLVCFNVLDVHLFTGIMKKVFLKITGGIVIETTNKDSSQGKTYFDIIEGEAYFVEQRKFKPVIFCSFLNSLIETITEVEC